MILLADESLTASSSPPKRPPVASKPAKKKSASKALVKVRPGSEYQVEAPYVAPQKEYRMCWLACGGDPALLPEIQARWAKEDAEDAAARRKAPKLKSVAPPIPVPPQVEIAEEEALEPPPESSVTVKSDTTPVEPLIPLEESTLKKAKPRQAEEPKPAKKAKQVKEPKPAKKVKKVDPKPATPKTSTGLVLVSTPKSRYAAYIRGFGQGASGRKRSEEDRDFEDYAKGFEEGAAAREAASDAYAEVVGYKPLILKVQDL